MSGVGAVGALWYSDLEEKGSNSPIIRCNCVSCREHRNLVSELLYFKLYMVII